MNLVKVDSSSKDSLARRIIKFLRFGKNDVQTSFAVSPYGIDSHPIKNMIALYAETGEKGKTVIVGYINKNAMAEAGEVRLFSTDNNGSEKIFIWLKNDGTAELGGSADNLARYKPIEQLVTNLNNFLNQQLPLIASGIATGGGSYSPGTANFNISDAKINELKSS